jgi:2-polyprenyl-6-hydroxyphenyl methylase/3-demethylubiquinone-9 3-methyltransferase
MVPEDAAHKAGAAVCEAAWRAVGGTGPFAPPDGPRLDSQTQHILLASVRVRLAKPNGMNGMDQLLETRLAALPRLSRENAAAAAIPCKICGRPAEFFDLVDFQKCVGNYHFGPAGVQTAWYRCEHCGFLFTPFVDNWSHEDFARFIYNDDYVLVDPDYAADRPKAVARNLAALMKGYEACSILDYGSGGGLLAESLASLGFRDVKCYDPFSRPERPVGKFDIIICNEVIEHTPFPLRAVADMRSLLREEGCIILGETLQPVDIRTVRCSWWYVAPRNGHVSTFTDATFAYIAGESRLVFHRGQGSVHALRTLQEGAFAELARRCGPSLMAYRIGAPGPGSIAGWSGIEDKPPWQFRWTTSTTLNWRIAAPSWRPQCLQITVPFIHESRHGFAAGCTIEVGGQAAGTQVRDKSIFSEAAAADAGDILLTLRTPDLQTAGGRQIGIAIRVF